MLTLWVRTPTLPPCAHCRVQACIVAGLATLAGYYVGCRGWFHEYTTSEQSPADYTRFATAYNAGQAAVLGMSVGLVGLALALWLWQRGILRRLFRDWDRAAAKAEAQEALDLLGLEGAAAATRSTLLDLQRRGYLEVAAPLEPYVVVFLVFLVVQAVEASAACSAQTFRAFEHRERGELPCQNATELVLSFRGTALVAVFFWSRERRAELWDVRQLLGLTWGRLTGGSAQQVRFDPAGESVVALLPDGGSNGGGDPARFKQADADVHRTGKMSMERLIELDVAKEARESAAADAARDADAGIGAGIPYMLVEG